MYLASPRSSQLSSRMQCDTKQLIPCRPSATPSQLNGLAIMELVYAPGMTNRHDSRCTRDRPFSVVDAEKAMLTCR